MIAKGEEFVYLKVLCGMYTGFVVCMLLCAHLYAHTDAIDPIPILLLEKLEEDDR